MSRELASGVHGSGGGERVPASGALRSPAEEANRLGCEDLGQPELTLQMLSMGPLEIPVLLLDIDQKQTQWSAFHFLSDPKDGLGTNTFGRGDRYHRTWRDLQWAMGHASGKFNWTCVQLNTLANVNYEPFGAGGHLDTRRELKLEWEHLFPDIVPEFAALVQSVALDNRVPVPTAPGASQAMYRRHVLDDDMMTKKGPFMKQSAWYSIIATINIIDPKWHARRHMTEQVAAHLRRTGAKSSKAVVAREAKNIIIAPEAAHNEESTKDSHRNSMRHLRKIAGNLLLLAPRLMNNQNLVNARSMLLVARAAWSEQTLWSTHKITAQQDLKLSVLLAEGLGDDMIRSMWVQSTGDARELHRLGVQVCQGEPFVDVSQSTGLGDNLHPGVPLSEVPDRLMGFLLHFAEARLWTYAWHQFACPEAFAALLSTARAEEFAGWAQRLWEASVRQLSIAIMGG